MYFLFRSIIYRFDANNIGSLFQEYDSDSDNLETVLPVNEVVDDDVC